MLPLLLLTIEDQARREEYAAAYLKYRQHMFVVANLILRDEYAAEDAVQNAFYSIIRSDSLPRICAGSSQGDPEDRIKAFLTIVVRNKAIDLLRSSGRADTQELTDWQPSVSAEATEAEQTINALPAIYRDVLINYYYVGLSAKEIAQNEGVHQHTILRRLKKAEELFKEEYLKDK